jgi:ABC-type Fe3+ transport system substrate-binding protein
VSEKSKNAEGGRAFVDYLLSDEGQKTLEEAGFGRP